MSQTGISIGDDVMDYFVRIQRKKEFSYLKLTIDLDKGQVVVAGTGERHPNADEAQQQEFWRCFCEKELHPTTPAFYLLDFPFGDKLSKLILFLWNPDSGPVKGRMLYAGTTAALQNAFGVRLLSLCLSLQGSLAGTITASDQTDTEFSQMKK